MVVGGGPFQVTGYIPESRLETALPPLCFIFLPRRRNRAPCCYAWSVRPSPGAVFEWCGFSSYPGGHVGEQIGVDCTDVIQGARDPPFDGNPDSRFLVEVLSAAPTTVSTPPPATALILKSQL